MSAIHAEDVLFLWQDAEECLRMKIDYVWASGGDFFEHNESAWRSFQDGYRAGGEIGRRRYGRPAAVKDAER